jgi:hypothetical protein
VCDLRKQEIYQRSITTGVYCDYLLGGRNLLEWRLLGPSTGKHLLLVGPLVPFDGLDRLAQGVLQL